MKLIVMRVIKLERYEYGGRKLFKRKMDINAAENIA